MLIRQKTNIDNKPKIYLVSTPIGNVLDNESLSLKEALPLLAGKKVKIKVIQNEQFLNAQIYPLSAVVTVETVPAVENFDDIQLD